MKHVLITGSTRGIGFGLAQNFLHSDFQVTINGTNPDSVERALTLLKESDPGAIVQGFVADVTDAVSVQTLCRMAVDGLGKIDVWINNAGIDQTVDKAWNIPFCEYQIILNTNVIGVINGSGEAIRHFMETGGGYLYNMGGLGSDGRIIPGLGIYGTSKRAVDYFTRSLMKEANGTSIKIGLLSPGMVMTDMIYNRMKEDTSDPGARRIFNILADTPETVTPFLVAKMIKNKKNGAHIHWLTGSKIMWRFLTAKFNRRDFFLKR